MTIFRLFPLTRTEAPRQQGFLFDLFTDVSLLPRTVPVEAYYEWLNEAFPITWHSSGD